MFKVYESYFYIPGLIKRGTMATTNLQMAKRILVVEDDHNIQDIFRIILTSYGYEVECLENGRNLFQGLDENWPDAIILDKQLPGISGIDLCVNLKANKRTKNIPVIMISAHQGIGALAVKAGADDFLEKPFNMHKILNKIFTLLHEDRSVN